ncbi:hypothetical protein M8494_24145 [Serratia ureilytica]
MAGKTLVEQGVTGRNYPAVLLGERSGSVVQQIPARRPDSGGRKCALPEVMGGLHQEAFQSDAGQQLGHEETGAARWLSVREGRQGSRGRFGRQPAEARLELDATHGTAVEVLKRASTRAWSTRCTKGVRTFRTVSSLCQFQAHRQHSRPAVRRLRTWADRRSALRCCTTTTLNGGFTTAMAR